MIETARYISRYCDIYKAEFPGTLGHESDDQLRDNLHALSEASERPWVLLSAGVDYPDYLKQVKMAMECGCSGVLGGRAFWKEYFLQDGAAARTKFAASEGLKRVAEVDAIVRGHGTPWFAKYGLTQGRVDHRPRRRRLALPLRDPCPRGRRHRRPPGPGRRGLLSRADARTRSTIPVSPTGAFAARASERPRAVRRPPRTIS